MKILSLLVDDSNYMNELQLLMKLNNECIIKYIEHFQLDYSMCIITEYCEVTII